MHFLLFYDYVPDYLQRRDAFRDAHLRLAWQYQQRGELILGGVVAEPIDGAVLFFKADSAETVEAFVKSDPYVINGLVTGWKIRPWNTVVGDDATTPIHVD
ncbi:MAG: YciI-like protein [Gammaproteobacteria bacterium]|nr:YciI-like protein [Gammaproteobacteria bacterium]